MIKNILVIDDDKTICEIINTLLNEEGYKVKTLSHGNDLIYELKSFRPDLFILDYIMPGKNGAEITRYVRSRKDTKNIPIIMIAGNQNYKISAQKAGVNLFLNKPFDIYQLLDNVKKLIEGKLPKAQIKN